MTSETDQIGTRNHGDIRQDEDGQVSIRKSIEDGDSSRDDRPEDVHSGGGFAGRTTDDFEKVHRVEAATTRLAGGFDVRGQGRVSIAIIVFVLDGLVLGKRWVPRGGLCDLFVVAVGHDGVGMAVENCLARAS